MEINKKIFIIFVSCALIVSGLFFSAGTARAGGVADVITSSVGGFVDPLLNAIIDYNSCDINVIFGCDSGGVGEGGLTLGGDDCTGQEWNLSGCQSGSVSVACSGTTPTATISWSAAPEGYYYYEDYKLYVGSASYIIPYNGTSYTVSSGLSQSTAYNWNVEVTYDSDSGMTRTADFVNEPSGSFTTLNCVQYTLTVAKSGAGSGTVTSNPAGIDCGSDCAESYTSGTSVALTASASSGSTFTGWSGACSGTGTCTVSITQATNVTATFDTTNIASCVDISVPDSVMVSQTFDASVTMKNEGTIVWNSDGTPHRLGSQNPQDNVTWGLGRVGLPWEPVNPNQSVTFNFTATAPSSPGAYPFDWKMVEDGIGWFGETCQKDTSPGSSGGTISVFALPTVTLTTWPTFTIPELVSLYWSSTNADSCAASGDWSGSKAVQGEETLSKSRGNYTFTLTCTGSGGSASDTENVSVVQIPQCAFTADPATIVLPEYSTLSWSCQYADSCSIDQDIGSVDNVSGTKQVAPSETSVYTLTCSGLDGSNSYQATVNVGFTPKVKEVAP